MPHFFTCNPIRIRPLMAKAPDLVFYDGHCGLCHRSVRFLLARDRSGKTFQFASLQGQTFLSTIPEAERATLPDSIIVQTAEGVTLVRSAAVLYALKRLGGIWRVLGTIANVVPGGIRDGVYDWIAGNRHKMFPAPTATCPLLPPELRTRFKD